MAGDWLRIDICSATMLVYAQCERTRIECEVSNKCTPRLQNRHIKLLIALKCCAKVVTYFDKCILCAELCKQLVKNAYLFLCFLSRFANIVIFGCNVLAANRTCILDYSIYTQLCILMHALIMCIHIY